MPRLRSSSARPPRPDAPAPRGRGAAAASGLPRLLALALGTVLALAVGVATANAQGHGLSIGWNDCRAGAGPGGDNFNFGCLPTINDFPLFPGLRLAAPVDSVYSMELVIDVDVAMDPLPDWWHMEPGGCRPSGWAAGTGLPLSCADPWNGLGTASTQGWLVGVPGGSTRHGRLLVAVGVPAESFVALQADVAYSLCRVALRADNTAVCAGCTVPACLVFNSVLIRRLPGSSVEEVLVSDAEAAGLNMVAWQGGAGADCQSVPTRRSTWGAVKALYR